MAMPKHGAPPRWPVADIDDEEVDESPHITALSESARSNNEVLRLAYIAGKDAFINGDNFGTNPFTPSKGNESRRASWSKGWLYMYETHKREMAAAGVARKQPIPEPIPARRMNLKRRLQSIAKKD